MGVHWNSSESWERRLEVRQLKSIWPVVLVWCSKHFEYFEDLVDFTIAHEKWSLLGHFGKDAACGPEVDTKGVMLLTK